MLDSSKENKEKGKESWSIQMEGSMKVIGLTISEKVRDTKFTQMETFTQDHLVKERQMAKASILGNQVRYTMGNGLQA